MADASTGSAWMPIVVAVISSVSGLTGVGLGAWLGYWRESRQKEKRHLSYWSAMSAEVELCSGHAQAYVCDNVMAPLYRLPTIAYDEGFPALLGDGAVSEEETRSILRFYGQVVQINRGLEFAHAATSPDASTEVLAREASRLLKKASDLTDSNCTDSGGPYYLRIRAAIDKHVTSTGPGT